MSGPVLHLSAGARRKSVDLAGYLDAAGEERAQLEAIAWIKRLRHAGVDGIPMRRRFAYQGESLWWFTEIYLHKQQQILGLFRTIAALDALVAREEPDAIRLERADRLTALIAPQIAAARGIALAGDVRPALPPRLRLARLRARARWLHTAALASRTRSHPATAPAIPPTVAAFGHRAFWRQGARAAGRAAAPASSDPRSPAHEREILPAPEPHADVTGEAYIGPVLDALEQRLGAGQIACISLGPAENFSARRWWHALAPDVHTPVPAIESYAPLQRLEGSRAVWTHRRENLRALWTSAALREASVIGGCDCWPVVQVELAGVALLQWPWSARAMDEAGAALDALKPRAALTYAEAGGWGRALMLECRRRGIPSAGLQHGFIYRHWLNYLHEPDEMIPDPGAPSDRGFPCPDRTLVFDEYAKRHLATAGRYPVASLVVTGSPRLDALVASDRALDTAAIEQARASAGAADAVLVLVVTKFREARGVLPKLLDAAALPGVRVAIKPHPAETPDVYAGVAAGRTNVTVLPAAAPLAPLLRASRTVVTVNSTVALDAAVLGIPALVVGLPNNLSPFVEAGAMAGAEAAEFAAALRRILYDQDFRLQLERSRAAFLSRFNIGSDGNAAGRSADAVLQLAGRNV